MSLTRELINLGFHDAYRHIYPKKEGYTFWDYTSGAWQKNNGMRIDHFLVSTSLIVMSESKELCDNPGVIVPASNKIAIRPNNRGFFKCIYYSYSFF